MKIGILSAAHVHTSSYARALQQIPGVTLAGLWDDNVTHGQQRAEEYDTTFEADLDRLLEACDAVVICSENVRHRELTVKAAEAGRHVLCEKPLATTTADARAMVEACQKAGVLLGTAFPVRQSGAVISLRDAVRNGVLGHVLMIRGTNRGTMPGGWFVDKSLSGGGAITDHTVHVVDAIRFVTGEEITSVYAQADTHFYPDLAVEDCGLLIMELSGGGIVSLDPSWSRPNQAFPTWGDVTMEVSGTEGVANVDYTAEHTKLYSNSRVRAAQLGWGEDNDLLLVTDFVRAIREGRAPMASGEDGMRAVEVVEAAYASIASGEVARV
ncbi:MAG: gfo/Idh/MocA family oxidoreductase [Chloroflexi bacterium]|nr:MAG: gfo/Idh/MocA family oxidoreductase [Chloroflexota bacterium]